MRPSLEIIWLYSSQDNSDIRADRRSRSGCRRSWAASGAPNFPAERNFVRKRSGRKLSEKTRVVWQAGRGLSAWWSAGCRRRSAGPTRWSCSCSVRTAHRASDLSLPTACQSILPAANARAAIWIPHAIHAAVNTLLSCFCCRLVRPEVSLPSACQVVYGFAVAVVSSNAEPRSARTVRQGRPSLRSAATRWA